MIGDTMSDTGGGDNTNGPREVTCSLGTEFDLEPGAQEDVCVDLEGEWREDSVVSKHPDLDVPNLEFVSGSVGEGGDHVNITFKNTGDQKISIDQNKPAIVIKEPKAPSDSAPESEEDRMETEDVPPLETVSNGTDEVKESSEVSKEGSATEPNFSESPKEKGTTEEDAMETETASETVKESSDSIKVNGEGDGDKETAVEKGADDTTAEAKAEEAKSSSTPSDEENKNSTSSTEDKEDSDKSETKSSLREEKEKSSSPKLMFAMFSNENEDDKDKNKDDEEPMESENTELKLDKTGEDKSEDKSDKEKDGDESEDKSDKEKDGDKSDKGKDEDKDKSDNSDDKPTIKLASFSTMSTSTENGHSEENEDGCYSCSKLITNIFEAIVWETMQFCDEVSAIGFYV